VTRSLTVSKSTKTHPTKLTASMAHNLVVSYYTRFADDVLPPIVELWIRLEVPEWSTYQGAMAVCAKDVWYATQSSYRLLALTFRPSIILTWIIGQFLFKNLLDHGGRSLQKGAIQIKVASIWFYHFQRSLSWIEILGEVTVIIICIAMYYFRKWLKRQTYWARAVRWYKGKKDQVVQVRGGMTSYSRTNRTKELHLIIVFSIAVSDLYVVIYKSCSQGCSCIKDYGNGSSTFPLLGSRYSISSHIPGCGSMVGA
jgi:hypothetical protein